MTGYPASSAHTRPPYFPGQFVTETAQRVALEGMQMMGGYGYSSEYDMERLVPRFRPRDLSSRSRSTVG